MKRTFTIIILLTSYLFAKAETQALYQKLDSVIAKREQYTQDKEQKINMIKKVCNLMFQHGHNPTIRQVRHKKIWKS